MGCSCCASTPWGKWHHHQVPARHSVLQMMPLVNLCSSDPVSAGALNQHSLVCMFLACRQPLPAGRCCQLCHASDWADVPWSSDLRLLQQRTPITLGDGVAPFNITPGTSAASLETVLLSADPDSLCESNGTSCSQPVCWELSSWGACSSTCGGGAATRTATCTSVATGVRALASALALFTIVGFAGQCAHVVHVRLPKCPALHHLEQADSLSCRL